MIVLAFDFGVKSIGVAQANTQATSLGGGCNELSPIPAKDGIPNAEAMDTLFNEWKPELIVVGLPFDSDGGDMEITPRARKFGNRLHAKYSVKIHFIDETLSTKEAKNEVHMRDKKHQGNYAQQPVDSIAARLILESWLNEQ